MKSVRLDDSSYMILLTKGEMLVESLSQFAVEAKLGTAVFTGIGSLSRARLGHYDFVVKKYSFREFSRDLEIASLQGNISWMNGEPVVHAHLSLSATDMSQVGGHADEGCVVNLAEIFLRAFRQTLEKTPDHETGLNIFKLEEKGLKSYVQP